MITTLAKIREHAPCSDRWKNLLSVLHKREADDAKVALSDVMRLCGLEDALWCIRAVDGHGCEKRLFAVWCVRKVKHIIKNHQCLHALDIAERYAMGHASDDDLCNAHADALSAARDCAKNISICCESTTYDIATAADGGAAEYDASMACAMATSIALDFVDSAAKFARSAAAMDAARGSTSAAIAIANAAYAYSAAMADQRREMARIFAEIEQVVA